MELSTAWFTGEYASLFSFAALASLLYLLQPYAQRGHHVVPVLGACAAVLVAGVAATTAAVIAYRTSQPGYVILALGMAGTLVTVGTTAGLASFIRLYRRAARKATTCA